jgi:hypothetical protein
MFSQCIFWAPLSKQMAIPVWVYVWVFSSVPLVFMSGFVQLSCCFHEIRYCDTSSVVFWLKIALAIQGILCFHMKFGLIVFYLCAECSWNFNENCIENIDCFWLCNCFHNIGYSCP